MRELVTNLLRFSVPAFGAASALAAVVLVPVEDWGRWITASDSLAERVERGLKPSSIEEKLLSDLSQCTVASSDLNKLLSEKASENQKISEQLSQKNESLIELTAKISKLEGNLARLAFEKNCQNIDEVLDSESAYDISDIAGDYVFIDYQKYLLLDDRVLINAYQAGDRCYFSIYFDGELISNVGIENSKKIEIMSKKYIVYYLGTDDGRSCKIKIKEII